MRLLKLQPNGVLSLTQHIGHHAPTYAILSHTWGKDEVTFQDLESGVYKTKKGWRKIEFCAGQASLDGLEYFWIDTCCIDKKNAVELSAAINSMFRWYQKAARCYVYLDDVSSEDKEHPRQLNADWRKYFQNSRWFTRGWTLQELIAPINVDFFCADGRLLGNKATLEPMIYKITNIAKSALQGNALSNFTIQERMSWTERRNTTLEEDEAYCLLGIFDVSMPLIYGEGRERSFRRLQQNIQESYKGVDFDRFAVGLDLYTFPEAVEFVSRETELAEMHRLLYGHPIRATVVLHGLGGIGKTQLTIAYTKRHKEKYTAFFWLNATDNESLISSFRDIAQQILKTHPSTGILASLNTAENIDHVIDVVRGWLELRKNARWLMIYDNYDNPKIPGNFDNLAIDLRRYLPRADHGSVLITTRSSQVRLGPRINVKKLPMVQEGLEILSNVSGRKGIETDPDAVKLVQELDGLPLALSTAGAYLEQVTTSFSEYRQLYKASWLRLQRASPPLSSYEDRSLYSTWQITFNRIQQQNIESAKLLKLWGYFDRQDMWFELLQHRNSLNEEWLQELTKDKMNFDKAMRLLRDYGLVDMDSNIRQQPGSTGYSVHSCVHSWMMFVLNEQWDNTLARLALTCVASMVPSIDKDNWWLLQRRLLQHTSRLMQLINDNKMDHKGMDQDFFNLGELFSGQGKLAEAEAMYNRALQGNEESLGPKHISTLNTVNSLGMLYKEQDKRTEAEKMYNRALEGYEEALGPKHISTLNAVNNLGILFREQGKLAEAEAMYSRALKGFEEALGPNHTSTLNTVNNLGILYFDKGKLEEAEVMFNRALKGKEEVHGPKHMSTLDTANNLGLIYANQGKLEKAESIFNGVLQNKEEALGITHKLTLHTVHSLGLIYRGQSKLVEAEVMLIRALQGYEDILGPKHTSTLHTANNLGIVYCELEKLAAAEALFRRALQGKEEVLGPKHAMTLETVNNLGLLYTKKGKLTKAEALYNRARQGFEEAHGPKHMSTLEIFNNLGLLYKDQGKLAEAEAIYGRALQGREEALGPKHTSTLDTVNNLGNLYKDQGKLIDAEAMYNRALQGRKEALGPNHTSTLDSVNDLGLLYFKQGKIVESEDMYNRALKGKEEVIGPNHTSTLSTVNDLGLLYFEQDKIVEAEAMYTRALKGYEMALGQEFMSSGLPALTTILNFGDLYTKTDHTDEAREMYARALSGFTDIEGPSSTRCIRIKSQLEELQSRRAEPEAPEDEYSEAKRGTKRKAEVSGAGLFWRARK